MNQDSVEYLAQAHNMVYHGSFYAANWDVWPHNFSFYSLRPPMYGLLVLVTAEVSSNVYVLLFVQSVLSIFIWVKLRHFVLQFVPAVNESRLHLYLVLALLLNPIQLVLCNSVFSDILFQFFISLSFFSLLNFIYFKKSNYFLYYTMYIVFALFTKPAFVYYAYFNILFAWYVYFKLKRSWTVIACSFILPLFIIMVSVINKRVTGYYHFSSSKVENLWTYNTTNFLNLKYGHDSGYTYKKEIWLQSKLQPDFEHQYQFLDSACTHVLMQNIVSYTWYHSQGVLNFFVAPGREFVNSYLDQDEAQPKSFIKELNVNGWKGVKNYFTSQPLSLFLLNVLVVLWNLFVLLGLCFFVFSKRIPLPLKISALILLLYIAGISSMAMGTARYKVAIYPVLLFCSTYFLGTKREA